METLRLARLLRTRRKGPCDRAVEQGNELPPFPLELHPTPKEPGTDIA
jgi:hypothetical protein